jgi:Asp-tRNA(Asn)/Glu-tRNA(Gln) amidotransferase A subunit family amidase
LPIDYELIKWSALMDKKMPGTRVSRRKFLAAASAAIASLEVESLRKVSAATTGLEDLSATEAVARMRRGELKAEDYAKALLERCNAQKSLNAFITLNPDQVLRDARAADQLRTSGARLGALHGLPIPVKDCVNTKDYATTAGTAALRNFHPAADAPVMATLRSAGAIVLGKTNLHELSYGWTSNNHAFGAVHNPFDATRIPGGSSGGTAAAVAARMAPLGIAADTEGSIRVPAALCGLVGFRPTTGRYSTEGLAPISPLFDQVGPVARTIEDIVLFDSVVAMPAQAPKLQNPRDVRIAVCRSFYFDGLDPRVAKHADEALRRLQEAGVTIVDTELPGLSDLIGRITDQVQYHDTKPALSRYLEQYHAGVTFDALVSQSSDDIRETFVRYVLPDGSDAVSDAFYQKIVDVYLPRLRALFHAAFERTGAEAIAFPTTMTVAPHIGEESTLPVAGHSVPFEVAMSRNIAPGSTAGLPGLVMPIGLTADGLPVSLEFDGPARSDHRLLGIGAMVEGLLGRGAAPRS